MVCKLNTTWTKGFSWDLFSDNTCPPLPWITGKKFHNSSVVIQDNQSFSLLLPAEWLVERLLPLKVLSRLFVVCLSFLSLRTYNASADTVSNARNCSLSNDFVNDLQCARPHFSNLGQLANLGCFNVHALIEASLQASLWLTVDPLAVDVFCCDSETKIQDRLFILSRKACIVRLNNWGSTSSVRLLMYLQQQMRTRRSQLRRRRNWS